MTAELPPLPLPEGVESHYLESHANDLRYHFLSSGKRGDPLVLLYHGFPEFSYCWRHVLPKLKGYYAVAPDTRGSGRTTTTQSVSYTKAAAELYQYEITKTVRDVVILVKALGYSKIHCLVGHDAGGVLAPFVALARPDMVERLIVASHPYTGPPDVPFDIATDSPALAPAKKDNIHDDLAKLAQPRKHYKWYYAGEEAAKELHEPIQGLTDFLEGYYYLKSANWPGNKPHQLTNWNAAELAKMPYYYIMPKECGMREAVKRQVEVSNGRPDCNPWLTKEELTTFAAEWTRTGFQGALNWYRISTQPEWQRDLQMFVGAKIQCPCVTMLGRQDWGSYQQPGVLQAVGDKCMQYQGERWVENAGHWMQQEKVDEVVNIILEMCSE